MLAKLLIIWQIVTFPFDYQFWERIKNFWLTAFFLKNSGQKVIQIYIHLRWSVEECPSWSGNKQDNTMFIRIWSVWTEKAVWSYICYLFFQSFCYCTLLSLIKYFFDIKSIYFGNDISSSRLILSLHQNVKIEKALSSCL